MSVYNSCSSCSGSGGFKCAQCRCSTCNSTGRVQQRCDVCQATGRVTCQNCSGTGQVLKKKGWFSDTYVACYHCKGSRQQQCGSCQQGLKESTCQTCKGTGAALNCSNCRGQGRTWCAACSGSGKVRPNWSPDRIREEIAQRRSAMREEEELSSGSLMTTTRGPIFTKRMDLGEGAMNERFLGYVRRSQSWCPGCKPLTVRGPVVFLGSSRRASVPGYVYGSELSGIQRSNLHAHLVDRQFTGDVSIENGSGASGGFQSL